MNYQIIKDAPRLREFIDWLPELQANERFYCTLFARKKYMPSEIRSSDKAQLRRFLADKDRLYDKIKQLEVPFGSYRLKGGEVPQASLVLYINPNPRNLEIAAYDTILELTKALKNKHQNLNPYAEVMSCIQRSLSRKIYLDFDVDRKDLDFKKISAMINKDSLHVLETRGGYHLLVELSKVDDAYKKTFYKEISSLGVDQVGDQLIPVPGCVQGDFSPQFIFPFNTP